MSKTIHLAIDQSSESKKIRRYCEEKLAPFYRIIYTTASCPYVPSVILKDKGSYLIYGTNLWDFLYKLRKKIEKLALAPLVWFEYDGWTPVFNSRLHYQLNSKLGQLILSLKERCGLAYVRLHIYVSCDESVIEQYSINGKYNMWTRKSNQCSKTFIIHYTKEMLYSCPKSEIKAAFAHEFGHIVEFVNKRDKPLNSRRLFIAEHRCDNFSAKYVGLKAILNLRINIHKYIAQRMKTRKDKLDKDEKKDYKNSLKDNAKLIRVLLKNPPD